MSDESYPLMISFAQQSEDVVLRRVFRGVRDGFYLDIGAGHPADQSVTKYFYDLGWSGINVEPQYELWQRLTQERPRDENLNVALGARSGLGTISLFPQNWGWATMDSAISRAYREAGYEPVEQSVDIATVDSILSARVDRRIDFVKIDVEGAEADVLAGFDLERWKPVALVVEATRPNSTEFHAPWEAQVLEAGYVRTLFDGLNNFYVRADDEERCRLGSAPCNVFDNSIPYYWWNLLSADRRAELADAHRAGGRDVSMLDRVL